jgi:hypothetical protein
VDRPSGAAGLGRRGRGHLRLGAGLILSSSLTRRYLGDVDAGNLLQAAVPDVQRYLKLRAM